MRTFAACVVALCVAVGAAPGCSTSKMCIVATECVATCGGPVVANVGCDDCPSGTFSKDDLMKCPCTSGGVMLNQACFKEGAVCKSDRGFCPGYPVVDCTCQSGHFNCPDLMGGMPCPSDAGKD